jgi:uncharacterized membrane protein YedE/YeeE
MQMLFAAFAGLLFGVGLIISGMADPAYVKGFLNVTGAWNPTLLLVMAGALSVSAVAFAVARKSRNPMVNQAGMRVRNARLDGRLLAGSAVFGLGWGLAGICPGPAMTLLGRGSPEGVLFFVAMMVGMGIFEIREVLRVDRQGKALEAT